MLHERTHTFILQFAYDAGPQVLHLLVGVRQLLVLNALQDVVLCRFIEEIQHQLHRFVKGEYLQLVCIL